MKIICPTCNAEYNIPDDRIPIGKTASATCKKCGGKIVITRKAQEPEEPSFQFETGDHGEVGGDVVESRATPVHTSRIGEMNVLLLIVLTLITFGIYYAVWFLKRKDSLNELTSEKKLGSGVFIFAIVVYIVTVLLAFVSGFLQGLTGQEGTIFKGIEAIANLFNLVAGIILWVKCFTVRRILTDHFEQPLSWLATFFFTIYYLQYKINRIQ